jgi:3-oxoacyl-[acyl-carrier protein] reductase
MMLKNKVALITGGSSGIGMAIAERFLKEGAKIAIGGRSKERCDTAQKQLKTIVADAVYSVTGDVSKWDDAQKMVERTVKRFGRIDILINNAGFGYFHKIADFQTSDWDEMFNLNVRGLFISTREALPHLRRAGESVVVNVASLAGKNAFVNGGGYAATKHAVIGFSRCLMLEERTNGVRILVICPGSVATNFFDEHHDKFDPKKEKILQSEDVADSIVHMIQQPQRAMVSEIDIRPSNP